MTREEKERLLAEIEKQYKWLMTKSPTIYMMDIAFDAIRKAVIDEVEQEPKISLDTYKQVTKERDIAIEQLHELGYEFGEKIEPKTGHWVKTPKAVMGEGYMWYCDRCEHEVYQDSSRPYPSQNYCPNCGAKMVEEPTNGISAHDLVQEIVKNNGIVDL